MRRRQRTVGYPGTGSGTAFAGSGYAPLPGEAEARAREYWELSRSRLRTIRVLSLLLVLMTCAAVLFATGVLSPVTSGRAPRVTAMELKNLGELATQAGYFSILQTVDISRKVGGITIPGAADTYQFSYDGVIRAGLDFGAIGVQADEQKHTITLIMPEVRILSRELDENSFQQYSGGGNLLTQLTPAELETGREMVKDRAEASAKEKGILEDARKNAEALIREFLSQGYDPKVYTIEFQWP